ncbi:hypothetical protein [Streptomyces sp. NPDC088757]|uniref:hypothetical protein n=1 Tax=Streptomyces sp. NPDC088757 TaxID=3365889 RepID=UPI0037FACD68
MSLYEAAELSADEQHPEHLATTVVTVLLSTNALEPVFGGRLRVRPRRRWAAGTNSGRRLWPLSGYKGASGFRTCRIVWRCWTRCVRRDGNYERRVSSPAAGARLRTACAWWSWR